MITSGQRLFYLCLRNHESEDSHGNNGRVRSGYKAKPWSLENEEDGPWQSSDEESKGGWLTSDAHIEFCVAMLRRDGKEGGAHLRLLSFSQLAHTCKENLWSLEMSISTQREVRGKSYSLESPSPSKKSQIKVSEIKFLPWKHSSRA